MGAVPSIWKEQRSVESFEIDKRGRLQPHILFSYFVNCASEHVDAAGPGFRELSDRNQMWVLYKFKLSITQMPEWRDQVFIETWGKGIQKFYALRDFAVSSYQGESLATATSAWMILDKSSHRPQKLEQIMASYPWETGKSEMETDLNKQPELTNGEERSRFRVLFTDIDVNGHANAAKYLQWILDSYPRNVLEEQRVQSVEISFLAEAMMDDEIVVCLQLLSNKGTSAVRRAKDSKDLCRAIVQWNVA